jgi:Fe-S-cluster-containing dehydrogenase component
MEQRRAFLKRTGLVLLGLTGAVTLSPEMSQADNSSPRPAMIIDVNRCTGCHSCVIACKEQNHTPKGYFNTSIVTREFGEFPKAWLTYTPELCHHCENAPCIEACGYEATFALANGIVVTDWALCTGDGACVDACPYDARFLDPNNGNKSDKCDFCINRLQKGLAPACVDSCASHARVFGDLSDPQGEFAVYLKQVKEDQPNVFNDHSERLFHSIARKS